jgi:hypothetical protein
MQETAAADFMDVFAPGFAAGSSRGLAAAAAPRPETFITDRLFNEKPPDSTITFLIGGVRLLYPMCVALASYCTNFHLSIYPSVYLSIYLSIFAGSLYH